MGALRTGAWLRVDQFDHLAQRIKIAQRNEFIDFVHGNIAPVISAYLLRLATVMAIGSSR